MAAGQRRALCYCVQSHVGPNCMGCSIVGYAVVGSSALAAHDGAAGHELCRANTRSCCTGRYSLLANGLWLAADAPDPAIMKASLHGQNAALDIAVVIVSYRSIADLPRCLHALGKLSYPGFRVVVVENGGSEAYAAITPLMPSAAAGGQTISYICAPDNLGYAGGVNFGIAAIPKADAYWILNPDTAPDPQALSALVRRLERGDVDAVGCTLVDAEGKVAARAGGLWTRPGARVVAIGMGSSPADDGDVRHIEATLGYISGASMLVSNKWIAKIGLMRSDYFLYCEEIEWCLRATAAGMKMGYAPQSRVFHEAGTATGSGHAQERISRLAAYLNARNRVLLASDQPGGRPFGSRTLIGLHLIARFGKRRAWRVMGYALSGWFAGMRGERGIPTWLHSTA